MCSLVNVVISMIWLLTSMLKIDREFCNEISNKVSYNGAKQLHTSPFTLTLYLRFTLSRQ